MSGAIIGVAVDAPLRRMFDYRAPPGAAAKPWRASGSGCRSGVARPSASSSKSARTSDLPPDKLKIALCRHRCRAGARRGAARSAALVRRLLPSRAGRSHRRGATGRHALRAPMRPLQPSAGQSSAAARAGTLEPLATRAIKLRELVDVARGARNTPVPANWPPSPRAGANSCANSKNAAGLPGCGRTPPLRRAARARPVQAGPELLPAQRDAVDAIAAAHGTLRAVRAARRDRQRQDRGVSARDRAGRRARRAGTGAGTGDIAHTAAGRAIRRPVRCATRRAAFGSRRCGATAGVARGPQRRCTRRDRHALGDFCAAGPARPHRRRRRARRVVQAAGRLPLLGPRSRAGPRPATRHARRAGLGHSLAGKPAARARRQGRHARTADADGRRQAAGAATGRPAHPREHARHCDADGPGHPASPRCRRPGAAVPEPARLCADAVLSRLRLGRAVPALRRATDGASARADARMPPLRHAAADARRVPCL